MFSTRHRHHLHHSTRLRSALFWISKLRLDSSQLRFRSEPSFMQFKHYYYWFIFSLVIFLQAEELDASSPTFLLDPQSTGLDEVLLSQGSDSHRGDISQTHNQSLKPSLYEVDIHEGSSVSRDTHRLHWANSSDASIADGAEGDMLNGGVEINRNGAIRPVPTKTTRRRSSLRHIRQMKTWASRINCFAAGIFLTTGECFCNQIEI